MTRDPDVVGKATEIKRDSKRLFSNKVKGSEEQAVTSKSRVIASVSNSCDERLLSLT